MNLKHTLSQSLVISRTQGFVQGLKIHGWNIEREDFDGEDTVPIFGVTVAALCKTYAVFFSSNAEIMFPNLMQDVDVCESFSSLPFLVRGLTTW